MNGDPEPQKNPNPARTALKIVVGAVVIFAVVVLLLFGACLVAFMH